MSIFLRVLVIVFEILYYSLFMKKARPDGKYSRYLLLFILFSVVSFFTNDGSLISYAIILLMILYGLKFIVKVKISLYDLLFIFLMMLFKLFIEILFAFTIYYLINNITFSKIIVGFIKVTIVSITGNKLEKLYNKLQIYWNENRFSIRYIFGILMFIYIIASCIFLINFR